MADVQECPLVPFPVGEYHAHHFGVSCAFLFADGLGVDIHGSSNVCMPEQFLLDLQINSQLPQHR